MKRLLFSVLTALLVVGWFFFRQPGQVSNQPINKQPTASTDWSSPTDSGLGILETRSMHEVWRADDDTFDPSSDGWESEAFAIATNTRLKELLQILAEPHGIDKDRIAPHLSSNFTTCQLRPKSLSTIVVDPGIEVRRWTRAFPITESPVVHDGTDGLARALRQLAQPLRHANNIQVHVKTYGVSISNESASTTVDVETHGRTKTGAIQQNFTWTCRWTGPSDGPPRLSSIRVEDFEEVVSTSPGGPWLADCTQAVLAGNDSFHAQVLYGLNHWLRRIERVRGMQIYARTGLAVGDVNGDGLDDLYLCQPGGLANRLYIQNTDGTATDQSRSAGVDWLDHTSSSLIVDLDNDGDQDLVLATTSGLLLLENNSIGQFHLRTRLAVERSVESLSAVDYDNDGDLDIYICVYRANPNANSFKSLPDFVYHDANNGGANRLFRNEIQRSSDQWRFADVTAECGLDRANRRWSLAASWEDYDNDGDQDLYVANDYGQNCLYRNDGGQFVDVAQELGVVDFGSGMSACWGDYNRDGWMDLYVGNMFSSAGSRISGQAEFKPDTAGSTRSLYRRFAKGNSLFQNVLGTDFREVGADASLEMARWAWSSLFVDINNDAWDDVVVANGFITAEDSRDL